MNIYYNFSNWMYKNSTLFSPFTKLMEDSFVPSLNTI